MITFLLKSLYNIFFGTKVGSDEFGNKYYIEKFTKKNKRWVIFGIKNDTSYIPARWYGWINFMHDDVIKKKKYFWQKPHMPNLSGTKYEIKPPTENDKRLRNQNINFAKWNP